MHRSAYIPLKLFVYIVSLADCHLGINTVAQYFFRGGTRCFSPQLYAVFTCVSLWALLDVLQMFVEDLQILFVVFEGSHRVLNVPHRDLNIHTRNNLLQSNSPILQTLKAIINSRDRFFSFNFLVSLTCPCARVA